MSINSKFTISDVLLDQESLQKKNKYTCPICYEFIYKKSIYQCKFGHVACQECWDKSLNNKKECMICRFEVNSTNDLSRCLLIEQYFGIKECCCIYSFKNYDFIDCANEKISLIKDEENGCKEIINIDELDTHIENCKFKFVKCSHYGCDIVLRLNSLEEHENQCGFKLVKCEYCNCDSIVQMELENHHTGCSKYPIECPQSCSIIIERDQIKSHIENDCNNSIIPCKYYEYGCKVEIKRSELQNHLNNVSHQYFMGLLIEKLSSTLTQSLYIQDELVKKIEQSEKTHEKTNKEFNKSKIICDELQKKIEQSEKTHDKLIKELDRSKIINEKLQKLNDEHSSLITEMNEKKNAEFLNSLKYKNKWIISDYSKIAQKFINGTQLKSPSFQIYPNNFLKSQSHSKTESIKFKINVYPNGYKIPRGNLSIFFSGKRIKGTNVEFICKLVNVLDETKSIKSKFQHDFEGDYSMGWPNFIESKLITKENGWISKEDKLTIEFKVKIINNDIKPLESKYIF
ncbi:hypothetical protein ACTFIZ_011960 [Dictyostelium cf. discoideum]